MTTNMIMAAANQVKVINGDGEETLLTLVDNCHFGRNIQAVCKLLRDNGFIVDSKMSGYPDRGQGFIDESGVFHNRAQAYIIAKASCQPLNDEYTLPKYKLDSSCIRHFEDKLTNYVDIK